MKRHHVLILVLLLTLFFVLPLGTARTNPVEQSESLFSLPFSKVNPVQLFQPASTLDDTSLVFAETFDSDSMTIWNFPSGWTVEQDGENRYLHADSINTAIPLASLIYTNYRFRTDIRLNGGVASLLYRRSFDQSGYRLDVASDKLDLYRRVRDDSETLLVSQSASISMDAWHTIEISATLAHLEVFVDDQIQIDHTDMEPWYAGGIGLSVSNGQVGQIQVDFDNIQVWAAVNLEPAWEKPNGPHGGFIAAIEIDPTNPNLLYAAGGGGTVWKSIDGGANWAGLGQLVDFDVTFQDLLLAPSNPQTLYAIAPYEAIFRTVDGGLHWNRLASVSQLRCTALSPENASLLIAGTNDGKVYLTTDAGDTWSEITADLPTSVAIISLAITDSDEFWAGTFTLDGGALYHTINGGVSWTEEKVGQLPEYAVKGIFVDPDDPDTLYVGFSHPWEGGDPDDPRLFKTTTGGDNWEPFDFPFLPGGPIIIAKGPDGALYLSNRGNIHYTLDDGLTWETVGAFPMLAVDPSDLAIHPTQSQTLFLPCRASCIFISYDHGSSWYQTNQGITASNIPLLAAPVSPGSAMVYTGGFVSANLGQTWDTWGPIEHPFLDEVTVSPFNPKTVWSVADRGDVYTSTNGAQSWSTQIDMRAESRGFRYGSVYALAASPSNAERIYALRNGMGIFKTDNGGDNWSFLYASEVDYSYSFAVHPTDASTLYSGYTPKPFQDWAMVRKTIDGGETWTTTLTVTHSAGITAVTIDPNDADTVYAGSVGKSENGGGKVYRSLDAGQSWDFLNEHFTMFTVSAQPSLTLDPENPTTAYVGSWLGGTWKTADAGNIWTELDPALKSITAISLSPANPNVIYASDRTRPVIWISLDGGVNWGEIADFTPDGAFLVNRVLAAPENTVYASTFIPSTNVPGGKLYKSIDGGSTWQDITGSLPRSVIDIAYAPGSPQVLYVTTHLHGAYKSTDGGSTWNAMTDFPDIGGFDIEVDPNNPQKIFAAGMGETTFPDYILPGGYTLTDSSGLYQSVDGGDTWTQVITTTNKCQAVRFHPFNSSLIFVADLDDGLLVSADGGSTWTPYNTGLDTRLLTSVAVSGDKIYVGTQGAGVYAGDIDLVTGEATWQPQRSNKPIPTVYSMRITVDPGNSDRIFVSANPGGLFRSDDGGATFYDKNFATPSVIVDDPVRQGYYVFTLDPQDPEKVWLGTYGRGIYKSYDGMNFDAPADGAGGSMFNKHINAILVIPSFGVLAATEEGIYITTDDGVTWMDFSDGLDIPQVRTLAVTADGLLLAGTAGYEMYGRAITDTTWSQMNAFGDWGKIWRIWDDRPNYQFTSLLFHPTDPNVIYFGTFPAGIFKSTDGGQSWLESNVGWTFDGVFSMRFHPQDTERIYVGTYNGVNFTQDGGEHWVKVDNGWPGEQWVYGIDFDLRNPQVMYACSKNGENEGRGRIGFHGTVMKSIDGGAMWYPITTGLNTNQEFYECFVDPNNPDTLFLATQYEGVFISRDGGALWLPFNEGLTNPYAATNGNHVSSPMVLSAGKVYLYFGSSGSGVFRRLVGEIYPVYLPLTFK
jgi:photosystem II stability/assembly factor-like uncharacterized protein